MKIAQVNAELALKRLAAVVSAAEDVCDNRREVVAVLVAAISTVCAATDDDGADMLEQALAQLMKLRIRLPESQQRMRAARESAAAGAH